MYQGNCGSCGKKVRTDENYLKANLWASTAVFHWSCLVALMKEHRETAVEDATWKASRVTQVEKQEFQCRGATPDTKGRNRR